MSHGDDDDHPHAPGPAAVPSTLERLGADARLTGRGVTLALLDAGFTAHPDVASRVVGFHAVDDAGAALLPARPPHPWEWHGTQTSVVAAGDGSLSEGIYRGLASGANLLLIQVGREGSIHEAELARALEWLLENHERFGVRVVNISLGGDHDAPLRDSPVNQLAEEAVRRGLVLVVAAGNSGCNFEHRAVPPASAPSVITVGGYHDWNGEDGHGFALYCSSYGSTADGLAKPELLAPAMEVAAPIAVGSPEFRTAEALARLAAASDDDLAAFTREWGAAADLPEELPDSPAEAIREAVAGKLRDRKIVAAHYQHVDGTSFAAPIVASIVAQMLEANPSLTPAAVKEILIRTAEPIEGAPAERQGFGVVHALRAVQAARMEITGERSESGPVVQEGRVVFRYHDNLARRVFLAGEFNDWSRTEAPYERQKDGSWRVEIDLPPGGRYRYKLFVDDHWRPDPGNASRDVDPFGAFDSILTV